MLHFRHPYSYPPPLPKPSPASDIIQEHRAEAVKVEKVSEHRFACRKDEIPANVDCQSVGPNWRCPSQRSDCIGALLLNIQVNRAKASKNVGQGASVFGEDKDDKDEEGNLPASSILRFERKTSR